jgi:predicted flavoprotein YhiN
MMKGLFGITTVGACAVLLSGALSTSAAAAQKNAKKPVISVTGCVQKGTEANTYMLSSGGKSYELIGAPAGVNLADHVGHKVTVAGTSVKPKKAAKIEGKTGAGANKEIGENNLKVKSVKMVSTSCS